MIVNTCDVLAACSRCVCLQLKYIIDSHLGKKLATAFDVHAHMRTDQITNGLVHAISTVITVILLTYCICFPLQLSVMPANFQSSSSRMHDMNHNWSATKQRLHP